MSKHAKKAKTAKTAKAPKRPLSKHQSPKAKARTGTGNKRTRRAVRDK